MSLSKIQAELKAPKGQYNTFGKYNYRSLEDIVEAVKPLLHGLGWSLVISDDVVNVGDRYYIKSTATIYDKDMKEVIANSAFAREALSKKGMDESQISGACSSYARKYCVNGLFAIDDTKDADSMDNTDSVKISDSQLATLNGLVTEVGADLKKFLAYLKVKSLDQITTANYANAVALLEAKR